MKADVDASRGWRRRAGRLRSVLVFCVRGALYLACVAIGVLILIFILEAGCAP